VLLVYDADSSQTKKKRQTKVISPEVTSNRKSASKGAKKQKLAHSGKKASSSSSSLSKAPHSPGNVFLTKNFVCWISVFKNLFETMCFFVKFV
jgi:hypothetical protein